MAQVMTWVGPVLDVAAVVLLTLVLWRLGRDPGAAWGEREARLRAIFDDLRALVAQSEGLARDLDAKLAARENRLATLLAEAERALADDDRRHRPTTPPRVGVADAPRSVGANATSQAPIPAEPPFEADPAVTAARIETLADAGAAVEEIARRVGIAPAEVRLVIGLKAARVARQRAVGSADDKHA